MQLSLTFFVLPPQVVAEVHKAPKRRIDNMITRLADSVHLLQMHAIVLEAARNEYSRILLQGRALTGSVAAIAASGVAASASMPLPLQVRSFNRRWQLLNADEWT